MPHDDRGIDIERLQSDAIDSLRSANGDPLLLRAAIRSYLVQGHTLGLGPSELTDYFCVSTPSIVESAGFTGDSIFELVALFDQIHNELLQGWLKER